MFNTRLNKQKKDVANASREQFTRGVKSINKSILTDHMTTENHLTGWEGKKVVNRECQRRRGHVKEASWIWKTDIS